MVFALLAACAHPIQHAPAPSAGAAAHHVDPANIRRVRRDIPPGYEMTTVSDVTAPPGIWGLGGAGVATPPRCAALADPAGGMLGVILAAQRAVILGLDPAGTDAIDPDVGTETHRQRMGERQQPAFAGGI